MILRSTNIQGALRSRRTQPRRHNSQRGFLLNPFRFTVPVDPYLADMKLLLHFNDTNGSTAIFDSSGTDKVCSVAGTTAISTIQSVFGGSGCRITNTTNGYVTVVNNGDFDTGSGDFTAQGRFRFDTYGTFGLLGRRNHSGDYCPWTLNRAGSNLQLLISNTAGNTWDHVQTFTASLTQNTWCHIALVKSGSTWKVYVDGVACPETVTRASIAASVLGQAFYVGGTNGQATDQYVDEVAFHTRALWTSNFTPPTAEFSDPVVSGYRYYRVYITANRGSFDFTGLAELNLSTGADDTGTQLLTNANKTSLLVSTTQGSLVNAQDTLTDDLASGTGLKWLSSYQAGFPHWVQMDFGVGTVLGSYTMAVDSDSDNIRPRDWLFQGSNNGANWTTLDVVSGKTWTNNEFYSRNVVTGAAMPWDPSKKGANVSLSNSSRTSSASNTAHAVLSVTGHSNTGDWYGEITVQGADPSWRVGISKSTVVLTDAVGYSGDSYGHFSANGNKMNAGGSTAYGASWSTAGTVIGIRLNAGVLTFYKNGVSQGVAYSGLTAGPWYLSFSANGSFNGYQEGLINTGQTAFAYPVAGAAAWG